MDLDISQLRTFVAVAQLKSFSKAALKLCRVQSAVSQKIRRLEHQLGQPLFTRSHEGVSLTSQGQKLLPMALNILEANNKARFLFAPEQQRARVRIGMSDSYAASFFREIIRRCNQKYPEILMEIHSGYAPELWSMLEQNQLDLVLAQGCPSHLGGCLVHSEGLQWMGRCGGVFHRDSPIPLALFSQGCADRKHALALLEQAEIAYDIGVQSSSHMGVLAALHASDCVSPLLPSTADSEMEDVGPVLGLPELGKINLYLACNNLPADSEGVMVCRLIREYFDALSP